MRRLQNIPPLTLMAVVWLLEIPSGWLCKNSSKNRAKLSLVFGHFFQRDNQWFVHNFYIQDQGGCQMCLSAVKLDHNGELFWDTPSWIECMGICVLSLAHGSELRDSDVICILWEEEKNSGNFSLNSASGACLSMAFSLKKNRDFFFLKGLLGKSIIGDIIVFRGSNISCSLASSGTVFKLANYAQHNTFTLAGNEKCSLFRLFI